jgi:N6-adenosine-specific RNA methylase IME4
VHSRHVAALPALENALSLYAAHLAAAEPGFLAQEAAASPALLDTEDTAAPDASSLAALVAAAEDGMPLQLELCTDGNGTTAPLTRCVHANGGDSCGTATLGDTRFVLPPRCRFALGSAANLRGLTGHLKGGGGGFRLLVLDPPWECASVARSGAYSTLSCGQVQALPVRQLCHASGALVALWVTNRERIRRFVESSLLPAWGLELVAEWHWLKMAADGHAALPLRGEGAGCRRPYEPLLLARSITAADAPAPPALPPDVVMLAQPGPHSRKPRLLRLLRPYAAPTDGTALPSDGPAPPPLLSALDCCELFARELCADATSWGNEPLRFQQQAGPIT